MKSKISKLLLVFMSVLTVLSSGFAVFADNTEKNGWVTEADGSEKYYKDGKFLTGTQKIGEYSYVFGDDGKFIKMYDNHTSVGTSGVPDTDKFKNELAKREVASKVTFNEGFTTINYSKLSSSNLLYKTHMDCSDYENSSLLPNLRVVLKQSKAELVKRSNGNYAVRMYDSVAPTNSDCYFNFNLNDHKNVGKIAPGKDFVYEAEYKLGDDIDLKGAIGLVQFISRNVNGTKNNYFNAVLYMNADGYVYHPANTGEYFCKISTDEFTRISVSVHPSKNTFDFYVNGVLVKSDLKYVSADYDPKTLLVREIRSCQFRTSDEYDGSILLDNAYTYLGDKPVCVDDSFEARNGIKVEGSYLRYYKNNLILNGKFILNGNYFGREFKNEPVTFSGGFAFVGYNAQVSVNGNIVSSGTAVDNMLLLPDPVDINKSKFLGWKVTDADGKITFHSSGDKLRLNSSVKIDAVGIEYAMLKGASVKTVDNSTGLRFISKISKKDYSALTEMGAKLECHMMIVPTVYFQNTHGYVTVEALEKSGYTDYKDIKIENWYKETDNYYYYTGSVENIPSSDFIKDYSGVGYIKVTMPDGKILTIYTDYKEEDNARNAYEVAFKAYNDRITSGKTDSYKNKVMFGEKVTYSSYGEQQLGAIKKYADTVINLSSDTEGVSSSGKFYSSPYEINSKKIDKGFDLTLKGDNSTFVGLIFDGEFIKDYTKGESEIKLSVETKPEKISIEQSEKKVKEWFMLHPRADSGKLGSYTELPEGCPKDLTDGFLWNISKRDYAISSGKFGCDSVLLSKLSDHYEFKNGYCDMSDWQTMEFYVYVPENVGDMTIQLNFASENPDKPGSDYYGRMLRFTEGWNSVSLSKSNLNSSRDPLGWDKITSVSFTLEGWGQSNPKRGKIYFSEIKMTDNNNLNKDIVGFTQLEHSASFAVGGYAGIINSKLIPANINDLYGTKTYKKGDIFYLPVNVFGAYYDKNALFYPKSNILEFEKDNNTYLFKEGKYYKVNGESFRLKHKAEINGRAVYISHEDAMEIFGYSECYIDRMNFISLSNEENIYDSKRDYDQIYDAIKACIYNRPTGDDVEKLFNSYSGGGHPYLMLNAKDFETLNYFKNMDSLMCDYIDYINARYGVGSNDYKASPVVYEIKDGKRLLSVSRKAMERITSMALLYKLYEFDKPEEAKLLAERIWKEAEAVANFPDWHPQHFLDTAELAYPMAIAYDWLYDYWTPERRTVIEDAIYNHGLKATTVLKGSYNLASPTNNWNGVCNGGIMSAALAILPVERYKDDAKEVIEYSMKAVERGMWVYGPDGGYEEGPGYWSYGTTYLQIFISSLDKACGTNFGIYYSPGFADSIYFPTYLASMNTTWGFHDGGSGSSNTNISAWFALKANDGNINTIRRQAIANRWKGVSIYDIMYFNPHILNSSITLSLDALYSLDTVMTFRNSWDSHNSVFTGLHGGDNAASHGDLDTGNFIISVDGVHMICDLGSESYNVEGYFGKYRWSYYRKRAEGQNTIVMVPHGENFDGKTGDPNGNVAPTPDQVSNSFSDCLRFESSEKAGLGVVNMAPAFKHMTEGIRGLYYRDNRTSIVIQDEAKFDTAMDIYWFAHTEGEIEISKDGKSAFIKRNGVCLYAELVTEHKDAVFTKMAAESLDSFYKGDTVNNPDFPNGGYVENSRSRYTKLCVKADNVKELKLAVVFKVIPSPEDAPALGTTYVWQDIEKWSVK